MTEPKDPPGVKRQAWPGDDVPAQPPAAVPAEPESPAAEPAAEPTAKEPS